jgi:hypothetical protein
VLGGFTSRNVLSVSGSGFEDRRFARGTSSIRRRSMHVVERKVDRGSDEPAGAGGGAVEREARVDMVVVVVVVVVVFGGVSPRGKWIAEILLIDLILI